MSARVDVNKGFALGAFPDDVRGDGGRVRARHVPARETDTGEREGRGIAAGRRPSVPRDRPEGGEHHGGRSPCRRRPAAAIGALFAAGQTARPRNHAGRGGRGDRAGSRGSKRPPPCTPAGPPRRRPGPVAPTSRARTLRPALGARTWVAVGQFRFPRSGSDCAAHNGAVRAAGRGLRSGFDGGRLGGAGKTGVREGGRSAGRRRSRRGAARHFHVRRRAVNAGRASAKHALLHAALRAPPVRSPRLADAPSRRDTGQLVRVLPGPRRARVRGPAGLGGRRRARGPAAGDQGGARRGGVAGAAFVLAARAGPSGRRSCARAAPGMNRSLCFIAV